MATINKKLIHFHRLSDFQQRNSNGEILDTSIVFIKDAKLIWTHGQYYGYDSINGDLKDRLENIETVIEENELVISRALVELEQGINDLNTTIEENELIVSGTLIELEQEIGNLNTTIEENKLTVSSSLSELQQGIDNLNTTIEENELTVSGSLVELRQGIDNLNTTLEEDELVISRALVELERTKANLADTVYNTELGDLAMPNSVGGISAGTTANSLRNKTMTQLLDDLLFPTIYPTYVAPYCTISKSSPTVFEVGSAAPQVSSFTTTFNRGNIYLNGVEQNSRAGELIPSSSYIYHTSDTEANKTLPSTVALGNTVYYYKAAYSQGPAPLDNKGNAYEGLAQGTVTSNTRETNHPNTNKSVTINGTYPWFASTVNSGEYAKQSLVAWNNTAGSMSTGSFTVRAQAKDATETYRQTFILPRKAKTIEVLNTLSGDWDDAWNQWTEVTISNYNNLGRTYYKYYLTSSESVGARSIKATF